MQTHGRSHVWKEVVAYVLCLQHVLCFHSGQFHLDSFCCMHRTTLYKPQLTVTLRNGSLHYIMAASFVVVVVCLCMLLQMFLSSLIGPLIETFAGATVSKKFCFQVQMLYIFIFVIICMWSWSFKYFIILLRCSYDFPRCIWICAFLLVYFGTNMLLVVLVVSAWIHKSLPLVFTTVIARRISFTTLTLNVFTPIIFNFCRKTEMWSGLRPNDIMRLSWCQVALVLVQAKQWE